MKYTALALLAVFALPGLCKAQTKNIPPLLARYVTPQGGFVIGGGPESADVALELDPKVSARVVGAQGSIPLLTSGVIALAILPRDLTEEERAAMKRFTGGAPLSVPVMKGLNAYIRRDTSGAADRHALQMLSTLLSAPVQAHLAERLSYMTRLSPDEVASARVISGSIPAADIPLADIAPPGKNPHFTIIGSDTLIKLLPDLLDGFRKTHPDLTYTADLRGSSLALPALTAGITSFAPTGREVWRGDIEAFQQVKGYAPTRIRIAYASHGPRPDGKTPPAIYVHRDNLIRGLSLSQIKGIFAAGSSAGDITRWSQLGMTGETWKNAPLHVYGSKLKGGFSMAVRQSKLDGLPFSARYRELPDGKSVLQAVAHDPYGIGYATWIDGGKTPQGVKLVPLAFTSAGPFVLPDGTGDRSKWPISYFFNIYVDHAPGKPVPSDVKAFLRFVLSPEGKKIIENHRDDEDGYLPLQGADLADELSQINRL